MSKAQATAIATTVRTTSAFRIVSSIFWGFGFRGSGRLSAFSTTSCSRHRDRQAGIDERAKDAEHRPDGMRI
jgi:hypothetical protein